jgi:hypothetical protein
MFYPFLNPKPGKAKILARGSGLGKLALKPQVLGILLLNILDAGRLPAVCNI